MNHLQGYKQKKRRAELLEEFKQIKTYMGVFKITNTLSGKVYIGTASNLKNKWQTICDFQLKAGRFTNSGLQKDWNELGEEAFIYEVVEQKEVKEDTDTRWELKKMEKVWLEKLQPYGDRGYNRPQRA